MKNSKENLFIKRLQNQAKKQSELEKKRLLPKELSALAELVVKYPWQSLLVSSGLTAALVEFVI